MASAQEELYALQARLEGLQREHEDLLRINLDLRLENQKLRDLIAKSVENTAA